MLISTVPSSDTYNPAAAVMPEFLLDLIGAQAPNAGKPPRHRLSRFLALVLLLTPLGLVSCSKEPPEQALRQTIAEMQKAAEAHETDALFDHIAGDFAGSEGMDRKAFRRYVTLTGLQNQKINVQLGPLDVKLFDQRATVSFTVALTGGANWMPERAQVYQVETGWRLEGSDWMLLSAKWQPKL